MVRVYPGSLAPSTVFLPGKILYNPSASMFINQLSVVKIDRQSTAADIARTVAVQLGLRIHNPTLVEECPDNESMLDPLEYPMDRFLLWPQQAKSGKYTANKYKFSLREGIHYDYESDDEPDITRQLLEAKGLLPVEGTKC